MGRMVGGSIYGRGNILLLLLQNVQTGSNACVLSIQWVPESLSSGTK